MINSYRAFYEEKALNYPERDVTAIARYEKALAIAGVEPGQSLLDIACKDAVLLDLLERSQSGVDYTGLDISERVIEKNRARRPGSKFVAADVIAGTSFVDQSFDRVFALEILEHVPQPASMLSEIRRVLKNDGRLLISVPNPYYYMEFINELRRFPEADGHLYAFRDANIRGLLELCGFSVEAVVGTYILIPKRLRGAFRNSKYWVLKTVPTLFACSRIYRCAKLG